MPFSQLMTDKVNLLKKDGGKVENLKASVQKSKIFMNAGELLIEPGDLIQRKMSNGAEEAYEVVDPGFYEALGGIPAHYQMQVRKLGGPEATRAVQNVTYNITGHNARINQGSVDNSTNLVSVDARAIHLVEALRSEIESMDLPKPARDAALEIVSEVEVHVKSGRPRKGVVSALLASLPHVANVASIAASLMALL